MAELVENTKRAVSNLVEKSEDQIRSLIPSSPTIRSMVVRLSGCPVHGGGTTAYQPFGTQIDLNLPLHVRCPIGGEVYSNADFPDDGEGWLDDRPDSPTRGTRYYFVGWFAHWLWCSTGRYIKQLGKFGG